MNIRAKIACCLVTVCCIAIDASATTYYLCGDDPSGKSSMAGGSTKSAGWSSTPGGAREQAGAAADNDYIVDGGHTLNSPAQTSYTFPGDSLTIVSGTVAMDGPNATATTLNLPNCTVTGSATLSHSRGNIAITLEGAIAVQDDAVLRIHTYGKGSSDSRSITVAAALSGAGTLKLTCSSTLGSSGSKPHPSTSLDGTSLSAFTGALSVTGDENRTFTLSFLTPGAFPAEAGVASADSVTFDNVPTVKFEASGSFGENRGVAFVTKAPTLDVAEGETVVFNGMTSGDVGFTKTGAGDLVLSNDVQSLSGTVTVKAGRLFYKPALAKSATIIEDGGEAIELESSVKAIDYTCTGYEGVADGEAHGITVTVADPADGAGCAYEWSLDDGETWQANKPMFAEPCRQTVFCRITASGYAPCICNAEVLIRYRGTVYVSPAGSETFPYDEPEKAARDIATALYAVADGQTVSVGAGTYSQKASVSVGDGVSVRGPGDRSAVVKSNGFILSDGATLSGFAFDGLAQRAVTVASGCIVSNCMFRNASVASVALYGTLVDSEIRDCGGTSASAVDFYGADARMIRTKVLHVCGKEDAPISSRGDAATLYMEECTVAGCTNTESKGCAVFSHGAGGSLVLNRCRFMDNAGSYSIGQLTAAEWACATNCLFVSNRSVVTGSRSQYPANGILQMRNGDFVNCTFADNASANSAAMFSIYNSCKVKVVNCVMSDNGSLTYGSSALSYDHTMYPDADGTSGNITGPAVFKRKGPEPHCLDSASPGIGKGLLLGWTKNDVDLAGRPRVHGRNRVDLGCFAVSGLGLCLFLR